MSSDCVSLKESLYFTPNSDEFLVIGVRGCREECTLLGRRMLISEALDAIERGDVTKPTAFADPYEDASSYDPRRLFKLCEFKYVHVKFSFLVKYCDCLPSSIKTLEIGVDRAKRLPDDIVFPGVESLIVSSGEMFFKHWQFPAAKHFCVKIGRDGKLLDELSKIAGILTFQPEGISSFEMFADGPWGDVIDLRLARTNLVNLKGIEVFKSARKIRIMDNRKLENVDNLSCFPDLDYLLFSYCKKIKSATSLGGMTVKCFDIYSCSPVFQKECLSLFAESYLLKK
jgi:hypothetical protein